MLIVGFVGKSIYDETTKEEIPGKTARLDCHKKVTTFERGYGDEDIQKAQKILESGNYHIKSDIDKSTYMPSTLFDFISLEELDKGFSSFIQKRFPLQNVTDEALKIEYTIYENDRDDPKKKSDNCKFFRGYVVMKFLNQNNKLLYQIQIDFLDNEGRDIADTLQCALESFVTYK